MNQAKLTEELNEITSQIMALDDGNILSTSMEFGELNIIVNKSKIGPFLSLLRDKKHLSFNQLIDITAVDYPKRDSRFEVVYHLLSMTNNLRLRVKYQLKSDELSNSVIDIFPNADWYEREIFDMYGISFSGHPDMRRILTDYEFEGYPLRKDFPLTGFKEVRYDSKSEQVIYDKVKLTAEYRHFDTDSPWDGMDEAVATMAKNFELKESK